MNKSERIFNKKDSGAKESFDCEVPEWVEMICDLKVGAGYSYSKIAFYVGISPSEVHRIKSGKSHQPKYLAGKALMKLYYKVFYGEKRLEAAVSYLRLKKSHQLGWLKNISASFEERGFCKTEIKRKF